MNDKKAAEPKADSPMLAALKQKAANLKKKIERTTKPENKARAQQHLEQVTAAIKKESKS